MYKLTAALLLFLLTGCSSITVDQSLTATVGGADTDAQMEFWHQLYERKFTSNDDAFHGMLLFLDGTDASADYAARVATLKQRGLLPASFDAPANEAVTRGDLAVIIVKTLKIKGGLMQALLPDSPRYAMRELQYSGIYPSGSTWQRFTGGQFVSIIGRLEDYTRANPTDVPAKQLDGEAQPASKPEVEPKATDTEKATS